MIPDAYTDSVIEAMLGLQDPNFSLHETNAITESKNANTFFILQKYSLKNQTFQNCGLHLLIIINFLIGK